MVAVKYHALIVQVMDTNIVLPVVVQEQFIFPLRLLHQLVEAEILMVEILVVLPVIVVRISVKVVMAQDFVKVAMAQEK